jgi:hypothetical protein
VQPSRIDYIRRILDEGPPHIGAETEGLVTDQRSLQIVHRIGGKQPTQAIKDAMAGPESINRSITPDVPETTVEANPPPLRSGVSTAAAQRLMAILIDTTLQDLNAKNGSHCQLLHGAAWRPPHTTAEDASLSASPFKQNYYRFQIERHGDKVGAAAGDHLNLSAPWFVGLNDAEVSRKIIEMTARMRLIAGALSIALTAASPLYFGAGIAHPDPVYGTSITPWESARLGHVWPGRTIMDVSGMYRSPVTFRRTMRRFAQDGTLLSGRDVWLIARAQPGTVEPGPAFEDACQALGVDLSTPSGEAEARRLLHASFEYGPINPENPLRDDPRWQKIEAWRQEMLDRTIRAPRNRVEIRTLETPPAFAADSPGGDYRTPYGWLRGVHTFLELLFVYLAETPSFVEDLEYGELELQAAKRNEQAVVNGGIDARIRWIPRMHLMPAREMLRRLLETLDPLARALGRREPLEPLWQVAGGAIQPPAARIRQEAAIWYGIDTENRHNSRLLPDDSFPRELLRRSQAAMTDELSQIAADLPGLPAADQPFLRQLLETIQSARSRA